MSKLAYILLGSNISPKENIKLAVRLLNQHFEVTKISKVYETKPIKKTNVNNYLNACVEIKTDLDPCDIKIGILRKIETEMGRVRTEDKYKPRVIDLDLILYEKNIYFNQNCNLILPDPEIAKYGHIAIPLADLIPEFLHPTLQVTIEEIAATYRDSNDLVEVNL